MQFRSLIAFGMLLFLSCAKKTVSQNDTIVATPSPAKRVINVSNAVQLTSALNTAQPGDSIVMADGTYTGHFVIPVSANGTAANSIALHGSRKAILNGNDINTGYVLYLQGSYWHLDGFSITNGLKGLMVDGSIYSIIDGLKLSDIGEEGIHLRKFSSHNIIRNTEVTNTGLKTPDYGEGIYIGSAKNNWSVYSNGNPDLCDSNIVELCSVGPNISAECIDIKEGTTGGIIRNNHFDATGITGANSADSWIDVKGNSYLIEGNIGTNPSGSVLKDGYQVHVAYSGWGNNNQFKNNTCTVNASGYGFNIQLSGSNGSSTGNKVFTSNTVIGAASGIANIPLSN